MANLKKGEKLYLDKRFCVSGKESHLELDNSVRLSLLPEGGLTNEVLAKVSNDDYDVDWVDINTLISSVINPIDMGRVLYVSTVGNDTTAVIGSLEKKWATIGAAALAANAGDAIVVLPGQYFETINNTATYIVKNNVPLYMSAGANLSVNLIGLSFSNLFAGPVATGDCKIFGEGYIGIGSDTQCYLVCPQALTIKLDSFDSYGTTFRKIGLNTGNFSLTVRDLTVQSLLSFISTTGSGSININVDTFNTIGSSVVVPCFIELRSIAGFTFDMNINTLRYQGIGNPLRGFMYMEDNRNNSKINIDIKNATFNANNESIFNVYADGSYKNIKAHIDSKMPIWTNWNLGAPPFDAIDQGIVTISGKINMDDYAAITSNPNKSIIDFDILNSTLQFYINLHISYLTDTCLFNTTAFTNKQILSGDIILTNLSLAPTILINPVIQYGSYGSTFNQESIFLKNLTIRSLSGPWRGSLGKNNILGVDGYRAVGGYTNLSVIDIAGTSTSLIEPYVVTLSL